MNEPHASRAQELQRAFDRGFASLPDTKVEDTQDLLGISLYGNAYALQLSEVSGVFSNKKIARTPAIARGLLGVAGFRGAILPVYDLAVLIGLPPSVKPRWIAVVKPGDIAVAFEAFDGHLRVPKHFIAANTYKDGGRQYLSHLIDMNGEIRGVVDLAFALKPATA